MLFVLVVVFGVCWAPFHVDRLMWSFVSSWTEGVYLAFQYVHVISGVFFYLSSAINPVLYNLMSSRFRETFQEALCLGARRHYHRPCHNSHSLSRAVVPQKNGGKVTTAPENKVGGKTSLAPVVAEKLTSPHRKTATWAKLPKDRRSAKKRSGNDEEEEDKNTELGQDEKEPIKKTPDKWKKEMAKQKASPEIKKQKLEVGFHISLWQFKLEIPKHLIKDLPDKVTQRELKEVFKDAFQIRLVSKDGMNKRIAYADFKSQADAERALEDKQGTKIGGLAIALDPVGEKSQGQEERGWKNSTWRSKGR
ncbi:neuromedin-u receptor 1-like [Lynx pardinus]|uniref:Neuromedin-u receptor 1-like n=1 Tax=Lynx pardinus TaxID=191816 RepID=A0A485NYP9_LYNPA|nr:neuromedin-u receptor 1-like [Lynx pardinus]